MTVLTLPLRPPPVFALHSRLASLYSNRSRRAALRDETAVSSSEDLLDRFWLARGIVQQEQRQKLISVAVHAPDVTDPGEAWQHSFELPGAGAVWLLESEHTDTIRQVRHVSARLLKLQEVFGDGSGVDVAAMLIAEPRLLTTDMSLVVQRVLQMRLSGSGEGGDVLAVLQAQPSLLVQQDGPDSEQAESDEARRRAWGFGLMGDGDGEWARRASQLSDYVTLHGDAHVGFRSSDDAELARWAAKQRSDHTAGVLLPDRQQSLQALGFEFDGERAEWLRWYEELKSSTEASMLGTGRGADFYLYNWCCVQRIAKRSKVLAGERVALLDAIGFDWTGADALS